MNKKAILLLVVLSLVFVPAVAMAAAAVDVTLGGYIKLEGSWDSTQMDKNMATPVYRNNDPDFQHGRFKMSANSTRLNLTVKGPQLWGAKTTGFVEVDFDNQGGGNPKTVPPSDTQTSTSAPNFRMRHAMFRLNWEITELMLGQYWNFFSEFTPEVAQDTGMKGVGAPSQRAPQIRVTQKLRDVTLAAAIVAPGLSADNSNRPDLSPGESTEGPQLQAKAAYEKDLWGKAAFYGVPRGFTAQVAGGWQRSRFRAADPFGGGADFWYAAPTRMLVFGPDNYGTAFALQRNQQYLNNWMVQGTMFIPLIPTHSANLAGTASLSTQWYVGAGLDVFGEATGTQSLLVFADPFFTATGGWDRELVKRYGGYIQGQYYFTNQWFLNLAWGMSKPFGVSQDTNPFLVNAANNPLGSAVALPGDLYKLWQQYNLTLWYRPIQAIKFGLQYSYDRTDWFQRTGGAFVPATAPGRALPNIQSSRVTDLGENHRIMFAGFFYF